MGLTTSCLEEKKSPLDPYSNAMNTPPGDPYEIPPEMVERHHEAFLRYSAEEVYRQVLSDLQLIMLIDHSGSMRSPDQDGTGRPTIHHWRMFIFF